MYFLSDEDIRRIIPSSSYDLRLGPSRAGVYKIDFCDKSAVLKFAYDSDEFSLGQIIRNQEVLEKMAGQFGTPRVLDSFNKDGKVGFVMEYVNGYQKSSLKGTGRESYLRLNEIVDYVHGLGYASLDLMPPVIGQRIGNIILTESYPTYPILFDFGTAKRRSELDAVAFERLAAIDKEYINYLFKI
jgi:hypothetical protein